MQATWAPEPAKRGEDEQIPLRADGEPAYYLISASQLNTWWDCQRKWAWQYIDKIRPPSGKGAALGSLMHEHQLEPYLKTGRPLDFTEQFEGTYVAEVARAGLQYLPAPGSPGLEVEKYFRFSVPEEPRIVFRGFKDYRIAPEHRPDGLPHVGDHKSCGNWAYAKTADDLLGDTQAMIYAKDELLAYPDAPAVTLQWTYYGTKKPHKAHPVKLRVAREHVDKVFPEVVLGARELVTTLRSKARPLDVPFNSETCDKYGGCPFKGRCNLSPKERRPFMSNAPTATTNLIERIKARTAAQDGSTPATPAAPAAPGPAPALSPIAAKIAAAKAAAAAQSPAPTPPPSEPKQDTETPAPSELPAWADPSKTPVDPIHQKRTAPTPPPLPVSDQPVNCPTDFQPPPASDAEREAAEAAALAAVKPAETPATPSPAPAAEQKAKRGRPAGSKNKPKTEGAETSRTPCDAPNEANTNGFSVVEGLSMLYVDCRPTTGTVTDAAEFIAQAKREINESQNVGDYRFVEYGKGAGMLSVRVAELAAKCSELYLDTTTPEGTTCKSALVAMAACVVQATR